MGFEVVIRVLYGLIRLGTVAVGSYILNNTIRDFSEDLGRFVMFVIRKTFGGVISFVSGIFSGILGGRTVKVQQTQAA